MKENEDLPLEKHKNREMSESKYCKTRTRNKGEDAEIADVMHQKTTVV